MRVAIYARVSTARQAEADLSIPDQINQVEAYCKRLGHVVVHTYVEPGASATDDKRPAFQQMLADANLNPAPFDAIIVHSYSRFFRDAFELELNVRRLAKRGVKLIAITQELSDDPAGSMMRQFFALFDEYQSKENGKHTSRAMKENARRGNHNSRPPYGYRLKGTGEVGNKGREKKRLVIEEAEAAIVRRIYDLYLNGQDGKSMGMNAIARHLNDRGMRRREMPWRIQTVSGVLSQSVYMGVSIYNQRSGKDRRRNPETEWVRVAVPVIVDEGVYRQVEARRRERRPAATPPRRLASPHLLSGLLTCGCCGAGMVVSTGTSKGGKTYAYYTCQTKLSQGAKACPSKRRAVPPLEQLVLTALAEQLLAPDRIQAILSELSKALAEGGAEDQDRLRDLQRRLKEKDEAYIRLVDAIEQGVLPMDEVTRKRVQEHGTARTEVLAEIGRIRAKQGAPLKAQSPRHVRAFATAVQNRFQDRESGFGRAYLGLLVQRITVGSESLSIQGRKDVLAAAVADRSLSADGVRSSMPARDPHSPTKMGTPMQPAIPHRDAIAFW